VTTDCSVPVKMMLFGMLLSPFLPPAVLAMARLLTRHIAQPAAPKIPGLDTVRPK